MATTTSTQTNRENQTYFSSLCNSISTNPTVEKVKAFFISKKELLIATMSTLFNSCKLRITALYQKYAPIIKQKIYDYHLAIIFSIAACALGCFYPVLTLLGAGIGFATNKIFPLDDNNKILNPLNVALTAIGAAALAMPICSLTTLAITAGTIGIGRSVHNLYSAYFNREQAIN